MTIIKFCNYNTNRLVYLNEYSKQNIHIKIRLWSILKYLSVSYAYNQFKENIKKCLHHIELNATDYFEIYRNIIINMDIDKSMSKIKMSIGFNKQLSNLLKKFIDDKSVKENVERNLHFETTKLIRELCVKIVFSKDKYIFSDCVKKAFLMNLYSSISNVREMLFWHKCRMAILRNCFDDIEVVFPEEITFKYIIDEGYVTDFFMDKKIYDKILLSLEYGDDVSIGIRSMLFDSIDCFGNENYQKHVLQNIYNICNDIGDNYSKLYNNTVTMMERIKNNE